MKKMGINALYRKPKPSQANQTQRKYPYLLKGLSIQRSNQVWATDITISLWQKALSTYVL